MTDYLRMAVHSGMGFRALDDEYCNAVGLPLGTIGSINDVTVEHIERFAQAVRAAALEEAAVKCDEVYHQHIGPEYGEVRYGVAACATAVRALKETP